MTDNNNLEKKTLSADWCHAIALRNEGLLSATDLAEQVADLAPLEAYYIVRDIGLGEALPILLALSPKQLETCVDLDCWSRHDFTADSLDEWLTAFAVAGPEELAEAFFSLNYVVQLLYLAQTVIVFDPDTDEVPPEVEDGPIRAMTPDGFYLLELKTELVMKLHPFSVLDSLYQYDLQATHELLSEVRVDLSMQIEDEALRFRNGRLLDLGFVPPDEAVTLFAHPKRTAVARPKKTSAPVGPVSVPAIYKQGEFDGLFRQALALITDQDFLARLEQELVWTINTAIIAYGEKTQDTEQIVGIARRVRDTISLGLEALLYQDDPACLLGDLGPSKAVDLLNTWDINDLFKHGFVATESLQVKVKQALSEPCFQSWFELETAQQSEESGDLLERGFVAGLLLRHPLSSGFDFAKPEAVKAFSCLADVDVAGVRLNRLFEQVCGGACV